MYIIDQLKTEYQINPIGIVAEHPRFSWTYQPGDRIVQASYRILVASRIENLEPGKADLWDSGRILSDAMIGIEYQGKPLVSRELCFVSLLVESTAGEKDSHSGTFEMGLKSASDFHGRWVSIPSNFQGSTLYFRKKLTVPTEKLVRARAYICGIGYHEFYVNGKKVGDKVMNPGVTDYAKTLLYDVYDLKNYLEDRDNVVGVEVGYGWLGSRKMLAQFYFDYEDGSTIEDHSDCNHGWWVTGSPVVDNSIYGGEIYDARQEDRFLPTWSHRDFEPAWDNGWMYTILTQPPLGTLRPQLVEPIRIIREFPFKSRTALSPNVFVFDIGQNMAGWVKITVQGERGARINLKFAEGLCPDGSANQLNLRSAACKDAYILKGEGIETWAPRFTYHGFQYVEVEIIGEAEILNLVGQHVHSDVQAVGSFECSDADLNQLHKNAVITEENNLHSIMTDCPQRDERFGWLNDLSSRTYQTVYNFRMDRFFPKVALDIEETQNAQGAIADTAPYYTGGQPADVTSVSYLLLALHSFHYYGDLAVAKDRYEGFKRWVEYLLTRQTGYIMEYYYYADWVAPAGFPDVKTNDLYVSTLFLNWHLNILSRLAQLIGREDDHRRYAKMAEESRQAINATYYHPETGNYGTGTQTENAMAMNLGIPEAGERAKIAENVAKNITAHGVHSTCGNQGYRHLFYSMSEEGYIDLLIQMIKNPEYPGWGYMLACGATTVWERWESKMENIMHSFDHPMFGSYDAWFYRYFAGIRIGDDFGAKNLTIQPILPSTIDFVRCSYDSVRGKITSDWTKTPDGVRHTIVIPPNTQATLILPNPIAALWGPVDSPLSLVGKTRFVAGSGTYIIDTKEN